MKGLLIKDLLNLKQLVRQYLMIFVVMTIFALVMKNPSFCAIYVVVCTSMMVLNSFGYDEQSKFPGYELSMPISRRQMVQSKYVLLILLSAVSLVAGTGLSIVVAVFLKTASLAEVVVSVISVGILFFICYSVMLPLIFKLGVEKSRMMMVVSFMVLFLAGMGLAKLSGEYAPETADPSTGMIFLIFAAGIVICAVVSFISYRCALRVVNMKEY